MRTFETTHPWIKFVLNLNKASYKLWLLLGEAQSKCTHIAGIPLMPSVAKHLHEVYLAKGVQATTAIEGNTLSEEEVLERIEGKLKLPPSKEYLGIEIDNILDACNDIKELVFRNNMTSLNIDIIKRFNYQVLKKLPLNDDISPGELRLHNVGVGHYRAVDSYDCEYLLNKLCQWLNNEFQPPEGYNIAFGILKAIVAHIYLAWIHPFADGNGRTARLVEIQILLSTGVPTAAAHLLSNHYNQTRQEYYRQLNNASISGGDLFPFIEYALQGYVDGLKNQIIVIRDQQLIVHWRNFIYANFKDKNKAADIRRRNLIFDLSDSSDLVPVNKIRHISPRIAEAYADKTQKTVIRDINELDNLKLIHRTPKGVRARKEIILAFLPDTLNNE